MACTPCDRTFSLLCVEDDVSTREIVMTLIRHRYPAATFHCADNGGSGLELFGTVRPDIVLTDINMPVMNGLQLAAEITAIVPGTPIILISAYNEAMYRQSIPEDGAVFQVTKPIDLKRLYAVLDQCLSLVFADRPNGTA